MRRRTMQVLASCLLAGMTGGCTAPSPVPVSPTALEELGYEWPEGELRHGGMCSISNPGGNGVVAYTTSADLPAVSGFYDSIADRVGLHEAFAEGPSLERDGVEIGRDDRSTAWRLNDQAYVVATPGPDDVQLSARFSDAEHLTCDGAFPDVRS